MSAFFPVGMGMARHYVQVSGLVASLVEVTANIGVGAVPYLAGYLRPAFGPGAFLLVTAGTTVLQFIPLLAIPMVDRYCCSAGHGTGRDGWPTLAAEVARLDQEAAAAAAARAEEGAAGAGDGESSSPLITRVPSAFAISKRAVLHSSLSAADVTSATHCTEDEVAEPGPRASGQKTVHWAEEDEVYVLFAD
jgi:hypothetical protein